MGESIAIAPPAMNNPPSVILILVSKSERTCTVSTRPEIMFPASSSSLTVTVDSPIVEGSRLCHTMLVADMVLSSDDEISAEMLSELTENGSILSL